MLAELAADARAEHVGLDLLPGARDATAEDAADHHRQHAGDGQNHEDQVPCLDAQRDDHRPLQEVLHHLLALVVLLLLLLLLSTLGLLQRSWSTTGLAPELEPSRSGGRWLQHPAQWTGT